MITPEKTPSIGELPFQSDWARWGGLMTSDGQLVSIHCEAGQATQMLNAIHGWTGINIYANTNTTYTSMGCFNGSYTNPEGGNQWGGSTYWNGNLKRMVWTDANTGTWTPNRFFEYTNTGFKITAGYWTTIRATDKRRY